MSRQRQLLDQRIAAVTRRRAAHRNSQTDALLFAPAMEQAREHHASFDRARDLDQGLDL